jgi:hypothetical protein
MFAEDLSVFFDATGGFALPAVWGALPASVIFDSPAEDVLSGQVVGTDFSVTIPATVWPTIARDASITITGKGTFTVREVRPLADGALKRLVLAS